jgi:hypothetical protein
MIPESHHGNWSGENTLWMMPGTPKLVSLGRLIVTADNLVIHWQFKGDDKLGTMSFDGAPASVRLSWTDTFHAEDGQVLHGPMRDGLLTAYGSYSDGEGGFWGWTVELDFRSPDALTLRMFNVPPGHGPQLAVALHAIRA